MIVLISCSGTAAFCLLAFLTRIIVKKCSGKRTKVDSLLGSDEHISEIKKNKKMAADIGESRVTKSRSSILEK